MDVKKVLFISQEIYPYLAKTPMSALSNDMLQGFHNNGLEVRSFMPKYGMINERRNQLHEVIRLSGMNIAIDDTDHPLIIKVATLQPARIQVYFIYNDDFFAHNLVKQLETNSSQDDNDERSIFFVRGVLETVRKLRWVPDVIVCNGWISALAPLYIRHFYGNDPTFSSAKIVYNLFDEELPKPLDVRLAEKLQFDGINKKYYKGIVGKSAGNAELSKLAIDYSDAAVQCSATLHDETLQAIKDAKLPFMPYSDPADKATWAKAYADFLKGL